MKFKTDRVMQEFDYIVPRLRALLFEIDYFSKMQFKKEVMITHLLRMMEEQQKFYKSRIEEGYFVEYKGQKVYANSTDRQKGRPTYSVHQFGRGADLRFWIYTEEEAEEICIYINKYFPYTTKLKSCIIHNIGAGVHFHVQVPYCGCDKNLDFSEYLMLKLQKGEQKGGNNGKI